MHCRTSITGAFATSNGDSFDIIEREGDHFTATGILTLGMYLQKPSSLQSTKAAPSRAIYLVPHNAASRAPSQTEDGEGDDFGQMLRWNSSIQTFCRSRRRYARSVRVYSQGAQHRRSNRTSMNEGTVAYT